MRTSRSLAGFLASLVVVSFGIKGTEAAPFAYVGNNSDLNVTVIDLATNNVAATVPAGGQPYASAVNAAGTRAYIANTATDTVTVLNAATNAVVTTINLAVSTNPRGIAVNPAGTRVYTADSGSNSITVIDATNNTVITTIPIGDSMRGIVVNPAGTKVYAAAAGGDYIAIIDTASNTLQTTIPSVSVEPYGIALNPAGTRLYVANRTGATVTVWDTSTTLSLVATIPMPVGSDPTAIAVNPSTARAYVTLNVNDQVGVIDTSNNTLTGTVSGFSCPLGVATNAAGTTAYVVNNCGNSVTPFNTATLTPGTAIPTGNNPNGFGQFVAQAVSAPALTVSGTTAFPATTVGVSSAAQAITLTNSGSATLTISSINHSAANVFPDSTGGPPPNAAHWCGFGSNAVGAPQTGAPINIAPGNSCVLNVIFAPQATGAQSATITINSNAPTSPTAIMVSGTGTAPATSLSPSPITHGSIAAGLGLTEFIDTGVFTNSSPATITLAASNALTSSDGQFVLFPGLTGTPCANSLAIAPGGNCTFRSRFGPIGAGTINRLYTFTWTAGAQTFTNTVNVSGIGLSPLAPSITSPAPPNGVVGQAYSHTFTSTGLPTNFSYFVSAGALPPGLTITGANLSGTPTMMGTFTGTLTSSTLAGSGTQGFSILIGNPTEVTNTADGGGGSLRAALTFANTNCGGGPYTITFNIAGAGPHLIQPASPLPNVTCNGTVVDGYSQPGSAVNTAPPGQTNADIRIRLDGSLAGGSGLTYPLGVNGVVRGLSITNFNDGLTLYTGVNVFGNFIGVLPDGFTPAKNNTGVTAGPNAFGGHCCIVVGSLAAADVNLISAAGYAAGYMGNVSGQFVNNLVGVDRSGMRNASLGGGNGVGAYFSAPFNASNLSVRNNGFAYLNTVTASQGSNLLYSQNSAVLSLALRGSTTALYSEIEINKVIYDAAGSTRIEGNINAKGAGLHRIEVFDNPTSFGADQTETYLGDIDVTPTGAGLFPFGQTFGQIITNPSVTMSYLANSETFVPLQYRKPASAGPMPGPFAATVGGMPMVQTVTLTNISGGSLTFAAVPATVSGAAYAIAGGSCAGATVGPAASCTVDVQFSSAAAGLFSGTLDITVSRPGSNVTNGSINVDTVYRFQLTGLATVAPTPVFSPSATSFTFPAQTVTTTSAPQTLTVTNTGSANLVFSSITPVGPFALYMPTCTTVPPMGTCVIDFTFTPPSSGAFSGGLSIVTNAPGSPHSIMIDGNGTLPSTTYAPAGGLNFGSVTQGVTSASQQVTFTNTSPIIISPASISFLGGGAGFSILGSSQCLMTPMIAPMGACTFDITATPNAVGTLTDAVFINTSPANTATPANVALQVVGVALPPPTLNVAFAPTSVTTGGVSTLTITVTNPAATAVSGFSLSLTYPAGLVNAASPNVSATGALCSTNSNLVATPGGNTFAWNTTGAGVGAMQSCTLVVNVTAAAAGSYTVNVPAGQLMSAAGSNAAAASAALTVTAVATPILTVAFTPSSTSPSTSSTMTLTITNPGASSTSITLGSGVTATGLVLSGLTDGCGIGAFISGSAVDFGMAGTIPAMTTCAITVQAQSATPGMYMVNVVPGSLITFPAGNNGNTSSATLTVVLAAPVITSASTATGTVGVPFSYTITATNSPASFGATGLPTGLSINPATGVISGTPVGPGASVVSISATNGTGTTGGTLTINVAAAPAASVVLSNSALGFGSRTINTTSPPQTVTLTNGGTASLVISSITSSGDFGFTTTCPILTPPIAPTAPACNINVTFTPLTAAALTGSVAIASNAPGSPHTITLAGTGVPVAVPAINLSGSALNLGTVLVSTVSAPSSLVVTNTGLATLTFSSIAVTGSGFARTTPPSVSPPDCAASLAPTASCQIAVTCAPLSAVGLTGQITLTHNATGSPSVVTLSCTGSPAVPLIALTSVVDFGDQVVATTSAARPAAITNVGTSALAVSSLTLGGTDAAQFTATGACTSVAPGASCPVNLTFTPAATGAKSAVLNVTSNALNGSTVNSVALAGNGVLAPRPIANVSVTAIGFGNTIFAGATPTQLVTIRNDGGQAMAISAIVAVGDYIAMNTCPATLAPLASCSVNVAFSPLAVGARGGSLQVFSNASGSPHTVLLSGTGCRWFSQATSRFFLAACG